MFDLIGYWSTISIYVFLLSVGLIPIISALIYTVVYQVTQDKKLAIKIKRKWCYQDRVNWGVEVLTLLGKKVWHFKHEGSGVSFVITSSLVISYSMWLVSLVTSTSLIEDAHFLGTHLGPYLSIVSPIILGYFLFIFFARKMWKLSLKVNRLLSNSSNDE